MFDIFDVTLVTKGNLYPTDSLRDVEGFILLDADGYYILTTEETE